MVFWSNGIMGRNRKFERAPIYVCACLMPFPADAQNKSIITDQEP